MAAGRRSRAGLAAGGLALAGLVALAAHPIVALGAEWVYAAAPAAVAVALLATAFVFRAAALIPWALAPLLGEYAAFLAVEGEDPLAPAVAAGIVLVAELAYWAVEPPTVGRAGLLALRRAVTLAALATGAAVLAAFLLGVAGASPPGGLAIGAVGAAAAVSAVAIVAWLARAPAARER